MSNLANLPDRPVGSLDVHARLEESYQYCFVLAKGSRSNFFYGMLLTPKKKRKAMFAIYAWMRSIDDIADSEGSEQAKIDALLRYYQKTRQVVAAESFADLDNSLDQHWYAFRQTVRDYRIPLRYFKAMLYGQIQAVRNREFATFAELYKYCYRVASTVGLVCITIWGYQGGKQTENLAIYRGIALQLTNILRDVAHDARAGQIFIPKEFFAKQNLGQVISNLTRENKPLLQAVEKIIAKAAHYYKLSATLDEFIERDGRLCLRVMTDIYYNLFEKIRHHSECVLAKQPLRLNMFSKLRVCLTSALTLWMCGTRCSYE